MAQLDQAGAWESLTTQLWTVRAWVPLHLRIDHPSAYKETCGILPARFRIANAMSDSLALATQLLKSAFGEEAEFREGQWEAIEGLLPPGERMLVVQRTGWGKSV